MQEISTKEISKILREDGLVLVLQGNNQFVICDARNCDAVSKIINSLGPASELEYSVLVESDARLNRCIQEVPSLAWDIFDSTEKPIILKLPTAQNICKLLLDQKDLLAIRKVNNHDEIKLIQFANCPILVVSIEQVLDIKNLDKTKTNYPSLEGLDYIISLPATASPLAGKTISVVSLGLQGDVEVIRE